MFIIGGSFLGFTSRRFRPAKKSASPSPPPLRYMPASIYLPAFRQRLRTPPARPTSTVLISAAREEEEDSPAS